MKNIYYTIQGGPNSYNGYSTFEMALRYAKLDNSAKSITKVVECDDTVISRETVWESGKIL